VLRTVPATEQVQFLGRLPAGGFVDDGISMVDGLCLVPNHRHRRGARHAGPLEISDGCSAAVSLTASPTTRPGAFQSRTHISSLIRHSMSSVCSRPGRAVAGASTTSPWPASRFQSPQRCSCSLLASALCGTDGVGAELVSRYRASDPTATSRGRLGRGREADGRWHVSLIGACQRPRDETRTRRSRHVCTSAAGDA